MTARLLAIGVVALGAVVGGSCAPRVPDDEAAPARTRAIIGGTSDVMHTAIMALLHWKTPTTPYACSGTVIAKTATTATLLTAEHCVARLDDAGNIAQPVAFDPPSMFNVLPDSDWLSGYYAGHALTVSDIVPAGGYDGRVDSDYDVALVRFQIAGPAFDVIPILEPADDKLAAGSTVTLVGYGQTQVDGGGGGNTERRTVDVAISSLTVTHLSYDQTNGKGTCHGDSGGPALFQTPSGVRVAGIAEYGDVACAVLGASVRVSTAAPWIHKILDATPDAGTPSMDASPSQDATTPVDKPPAPPDAPLSPSCGKVSDPRAACAVCIGSRCCFEARLCASDPLCLGCGASPLESCYLYPPSAAFAACLATCPGNPCGILSHADAGGPVNDASAEAGAASDAREADDAQRDAAAVDASRDSAMTDTSSPEAALPPRADAAEVSASTPPQAPADAAPEAAQTDARGDARGDGAALATHPGCGCDTGGAPSTPGEIVASLILALVFVRRRCVTIARK